MPIKNPYSNTMIADLPDPETIHPEEILQSFENKVIDLICVLGPTASGKTRYAVALARELNRLRGVNASEGPVNAGAEILSGDSRQVYRGMDIGTGKDLSEYEEIPYHLIDIVDAGTKEPRLLSVLRDPFPAQVTQMGDKRRLASTMTDDARLDGHTAGTAGQQPVGPGCRDTATPEG